jgi:hypothetical protein
MDSGKRVTSIFIAVALLALAALALSVDRQTERKANTETQQQRIGTSTPANEAPAQSQPAER